MVGLVDDFSLEELDLRSCFIFKRNYSNQAYISDSLSLGTLNSDAGKKCSFFHNPFSITRLPMLPIKKISLFISRFVT